MMATLHIGSLCVSGLFLALAWLLWKYAPEVTDRPGILRLTRDLLSDSGPSVSLFSKPLSICYGVEEEEGSLPPRQ